MRRWIPVLLLTVACSGSYGPEEDAGAAPAAKAAQPDELAALVEMMTGSFSSADQAAANEAYYDIRLEMVPIWTEREDARWLYVEQAAASNLAEPYRQRVYRVTRNDDGAYVSTVFEIPDPLSHAGAWKSEAPLAQLGPDDLTLREGCDVVLEHSGAARFSGSTIENRCKSTLRGATYATSEVEVTAEGIRSWDRGFDAEGSQVWGAEEGPYIFVRL